MIQKLVRTSASLKARASIAAAAAAAATAAAAGRQEAMHSQNLQLHLVSWQQQIDSAYTLIDGPLLCATACSLLLPFHRLGGTFQTPSSSS
jgi:spermidine/putrescine-binding protein